MKHFNYILVIVTLVILVAMGLMFIAGTIYSYQLSISQPNWTQTPLYDDYLAVMNTGMIPFVVTLVITLGLCIPKRLFQGATLLAVMAGLVFAGGVTAVATSEPKAGLVFLMAAAIVIQTLVVAMTVAGSRAISYEHQGFFIQVGSALLHLGIVIFLLDFMALPGSPYHIDIFWFATALIGVGMLFSFYAHEIASLIKRESPTAELDAAKEPV